MTVRLNFIFGITVACMASPAAALTPRVFEHFGDIEYVNAEGVDCSLSRGGGFGDPALSPDGKTVAFVHIDGVADDPQLGAPATLWVADTVDCKSRKVVSSNYDERDPKNSLAGFDHPLFSLGGNFVYVTGGLAAVTPGVRQVDLTTRKIRFVIDGAATAVIRSGPYRGYLLVGRHMYYDAPRVGSYDAVFVVRPDAKEVFQVPGTDADDNTDHVGPWLKAKGWTAW